MKTDSAASLAKIRELLDEWPSLPDRASINGYAHDLTFGDLRALMQAAPPEDDPEPPKDDEDEYGPDREETDDR